LLRGGPAAPAFQAMTKAIAQPLLGGDNQFERCK